MSIIHDALKKVQEGLNNKNPQTEPPAADKNDAAYIFETPRKIETLPVSDLKVYNDKLKTKNKIKSLFTLICALIITAASLVFLYKELNGYIPAAGHFMKKTFYQLIQQKIPEDFKTRALEDLKPLAQLTINSSTGSAAQASAVTLNIHGIMANGTGNVALINNQVYQEGDTVDGAKIIKINLDSITVNINGTEKTIFVKN